MSQANSHGRTQALLLISKLLDCRDNSSPLTLIIDSAEQTARPLLREYMRRAKSGHATISYVSFETLQQPSFVSNFVRAWELDISALPAKVKTFTSSPAQRQLLIFDTIHPILSEQTINPTVYFPSLITPNTTLLAVYHADQPLSSSLKPQYNPTPFQLLHYLATTILTIHSFNHLIDSQRARQRSVAAPNFGIHDEEEGILQALAASDASCCVVEMEHRRKSGRAVGAQFVVDNTGTKPKSARREVITLLDEHPAWRLGVSDNSKTDNQVGPEQQELSFNLDLTDKQRRDREGVVLPYYDAQRGDESPGEGGRILYEMGIEDDFDEEEDEI